MFIWGPLYFVWDFIIIPGGYGARTILTQPTVIDWIKTNAKSAEKVMSVCTGAFLFGKAGLLDGSNSRSPVITDQHYLEMLGQILPGPVPVRSPCTLWTWILQHI